MRGTVRGGAERVKSGTGISKFRGYDIFDSIRSRVLRQNHAHSIESIAVQRELSAFQDDSDYFCEVVTMCLIRGKSIIALIPWLRKRNEQETPPKPATPFFGVSHVSLKGAIPSLLFGPYASCFHRGTK